MVVEPSEWVVGFVGIRTSTSDLVRIQLAEGLYQRVVGEVAITKSDVHPPTREQENVATTIGRPVLLDAGPGTGKTKTLVRRIEHLIKDKDVDPVKILVLTFSNEAAAELRDRLEGSLGTEVASRILASTFHGLGVQLLHALGDRVGLDIEFSIIDEAAQEESVTELLGRIECDPILNLKDPTQSASEIAGLIAYLKDRLIGPAELRQEIENWQPTDGEEPIYERANALMRIFEAYEESKKSKGKVDFADLIFLPYLILRDHKDVREKLRGDFPWILVDEYQDVSRATSLFLQQIAGPENPPWVVGDARQAIYRFRGADPENVRRFADDYPGTLTFPLQDNYRSAPEIIAVANELAALLEPTETSSPIPERWKPGRSVLPLGDRPVHQVSANSDRAEQEGISTTVQRWLDQGVVENDIAILARRNVDVRNIAITLKKRGIRAVTTGILTAEGAGGDLAAVISAVDQPVAIARAIYALNRKESPEILNSAIGQVLASKPGDEEPSWTGNAKTQAAASTAWRLRKELASSTYSEDAWSIITHFLLFQTDYLRTLLEDHDESAETAVQLEEILSTLALAATYRFTHRHENPRRSRLGFAHRLRRLLTHPAPGLIPPRKQLTGALRVMTCHAAKGLEFPCVVVAGQSLPYLLRRDESLPPSLRPDANEDLLQADSLLFVGVTRAERAVVVTHATTASGTARSRPRRLPNLLKLWLATTTREPEHWEAEPSFSERISVGRIWGGEGPKRVSMYGLGQRTCRVRIYLEEQLGARFRGRDYPLYPEFIRRVRRILTRVIQRALEAESPVSMSVASKIVDEEWPADRFKDHPHIAIYRPRAAQWAKRLAQTFESFRTPGAVDRQQDAFEWAVSSDTSVPLTLHLIGRYREATGRLTAIALEVARCGEKDYIKWSELVDYRRLPFILLRDRYTDVQPLVFVGAEGELKLFRWSKQKPLEAVRRETKAAEKAFKNLTRGTFDGKVSDWTCDRCPCRIVCPWWIGASARTD